MFFSFATGLFGCPGFFLLPAALFLLGAASLFLGLFFGLFFSFATGLFGCPGFFLLPAALFLLGAASLFLGFFFGLFFSFATGLFGCYFTGLLFGFPLLVGRFGFLAAAIGLFGFANSLCGKVVVRIRCGAVGIPFWFDSKNSGQVEGIELLTLEKSRPGAVCIVGRGIFMFLLTFMFFF